MSQLNRSARTGKSLQKQILILIFILPFFCFPSVLVSQKIIEALPRWQAGAQFNVLIPGRPVDRFVPAATIGYHLEFQYRVQYNKPFLAGGYFDEFTLSKYTLKYIQSTAGGDIVIREKANTRRMEAGVTIGFYPEINWLLQPYLQGRAGVAIFQTSSILTNDDTGNEIERISEHSSLAPAYGLDVGIHIVPNIWYVRGDLRFGFTGNTSIAFYSLDREHAGETGYPIDYFIEHHTAAKWFKVAAGLTYMF